jgi:hypothetical protein
MGPVSQEIRPPGDSPPPSQNGGGGEIPRIFLLNILWPVSQDFRPPGGEIVGGGENPGTPVIKYFSRGCGVISLGGTKKNPEPQRGVRKKQQNLI